MVAIPSKTFGSASLLSPWLTNKRPRSSQKPDRSSWKMTLLFVPSPPIKPVFFSQETSISVTRKKSGPFWRDELPRAFSRSGRSYKKTKHLSKRMLVFFRFDTWKKYVLLCDLTCWVISIVRIFFWSSSSSIWCAMQYLKHSMTEVTITALSDGLVTALSLERLTQ